MSFTCPACQNPAIEGLTVCIACGFSIAEADRKMGIPPQLSAPVADIYHYLTAAEVRRIATLTQAIEKRFPQIHLAVVIDHVPADVTLSVYTFWLFNRAGISSSVERGADNHLVLLVLDASERSPKGAACMIGYGLEPFLSQRELNRCLDVIAADVATYQHGKASLNFFSALQTVLQEACLRANEGNSMRDVADASPPADLMTDDAPHA